MGNALGVVAEQELTSANLYVRIDGQERPVADLHPDDKAYARLDTQLVLRQHPDAYFRLPVKPDALWRAPPANARHSLEVFLGQRLAGLLAPSDAANSQRLTTWGWVGAIGSALNAVGLLFYPLADSSTLATLHSFGAQPTALARLAANKLFSPLLAVLTAACLFQAYRSKTRRKLWISVSYLPVLIGFAVALAGAFSAVSSVLDNIK